MDQVGDVLYKAIVNGEGVTTTNYEAIKYMKKHNLVTDIPQIGPNGDYALSFEGMRKVVGGNGSGTPDGLAPYTIMAADFFFEDIPTIFGPDATIDERIAAAATTIFKPVKVVDKISDAANVTDTVQDVAKVGKKLEKGKEIENVQDQTKDKGNPLLPTEGKVGTFKELAKQGTAFDNITPHHMPSAAKMKEAGIKRNNGISMNMEQPHPGVGGRHRGTYTYGLTGNKLEEYLNLSYRDALAHDILDAKRIYMKDGVYTPEIREGLLNTIRKNRELYHELFNK